jgi:exodeoxyribonuclease VII large subunit
MYGSRLPLFDRAVFTVTELNRRIKDVLEGSLTGVTVGGEISEFRRYPGSGHCYFTIKDDRCQLKCVMWREAAARLRFEPEVGMQVVLSGRVSLYEQRGDLQFYAESIEPKGLGLLQIRFEQLKKKLEAEGLFDEKRKRPIPMLPRVIGIVTSRAGAVWHDMKNTILKRHPRPRLVLVDVRVQGEGAAEEIAEGLRAVALVPDLDVVIVGRGGGSIEDLWAFNEEPVVRAIAACPVPVVSAVGHETDYTLADFVADRRAKTPTDAATIVAPVLSDLEDRLAKLGEKLGSRLRERLNHAALTLERFSESFGLRSVEQAVPLNRGRLAEWEDRLARSLGQVVAQRRLRVDALAEHRLLSDPSQVLRDLRERVDRFASHGAWRGPESALEQSRQRVGSLGRLMRIEPILQRAGERVESIGSRLKSLDPREITKRGYSITMHEGRVVTDGSKVKPGSKIVTLLHKGELKSTTE